MTFYAAGRGAGGYRSLFTSPALSSNAKTNFAKDNGIKWADDQPDTDFARRFGIARLLERNQNLIKVLRHPEQALQDVQQKLEDISFKKSYRYGDILYQFKNLGFGEEEAIARADALISRELETDLALLQVQEPYALGGAAAGGWDPVSGMLRANPVARDAGMTFSAIGSSGGLGVAPRANGIADKKRLKKKFKRKLKRSKSGSPAV
jgi:hypothetical protein